VKIKSILVTVLLSLTIGGSVFAADIDTTDLVYRVKIANLEPLRQAMLAEAKVTVTVNGETTLPVKVGLVEYTITVWGKERPQVSIRIDDTEFISFCDSPSELQRVKVWSISNPKSQMYELTAKRIDYSESDLPADKRWEFKTWADAKVRWDKLTNIFAAIREKFEVVVK